MSVTWLHISDFHIQGGDPYDRDVVLRALVKSVQTFREQGRIPDVIFATGDVASAGKAQEYTLATTFFDALLAAACLDRRYLFVVPGNHDVDRNRGVGLARTLTSREEADTYFHPAHPKPHLTQKLGAFLQWYDDYFAGIRAFPEDSTCGPVEMIDVRGVTLGILPLNSALFCQGDDDHEKLWIGRRCLDTALERLQTLGAHINVALLHHPLEWLHSAEHANIRTALHTHVDCILRGHLHEPDVASVIGPSGQALHVAAGAAYQTRRWPNGALYATLAGEHLTIFPIRYEDQPREIWTVDPSLFPMEPNYEKRFAIQRLVIDEQNPQHGSPDPPDYRPDWECLNRHDRELLDDVHTTISGLPALERVEELAAIELHLNARGICIAASESGSGKSALAKTCAERCYARVFWVTEEFLDAPNVPQMERRLGIQHSLVEVLVATSGRCLVVFDSVERYTESALRLMARLIRDIRQHPSAEHVHILLTLQFEASRQTISRLTEHGVDRSLLEITEVHRPSEEQVQLLVQDVPSLRWALLRPELRSLLTNLKILEWVIQAVQDSEYFDAQGLASLTALIERLWERWADGGGRELAHSGLLMRLGILESETLTAGVPRTLVGYAEQQALPSLINADLVRVRNERVRFTHDLLGDWARLRVLVGEDPTASTAHRMRAASPRWHRAVRLYAQKLLEDGSDGVERWRAALARLEDGSDTSVVMRDLFLEAVFLATNAGGLLEQVWPMLVADSGRLLHRLLDRFLFVATLPDPRLAALLDDETTAAQFEHLWRIPFGPYWGSVLSTLHAHRVEAIRLVLAKTAQIVRLWLRTVSTLRHVGRLLPWRQEAAELALAVARECQTLSEEGCYFPNHEDQVAYEAVLYAAAELQEEVGLFCLEMAKRRDLASDIQARIARTWEQRQEEQRRLYEANPRPSSEVAIPHTLGFPDGPLRNPWPDGPRERVCDSFQKACLESDAFPDLIRVRPHIALEVLLAVCIEEPQHDNPYNHSLYEDCGVNQWHAGYPPLYFRGPFLAFLREAPEEGLSFVLRLVNFATSRWAEIASLPRPYLDGDQETRDQEDNMPGLDILIGDHTQRWIGDGRVFRWHHDWPLQCRVIPCALMALEQWLYEELDQGKDLQAPLNRLLQESRSLAFAGLLIDIGKRQPELFAGPLQLLLRCWELYDLDLQATVGRLLPSTGLIAWSGQPSRLRTIAQAWYELPHRRYLLRDIAMNLLVRRRELRAFFTELRATWSTLLQNGEPRSLRLLTERFNIDNYTSRSLGNGQVEIAFQWPDDIQQAFEATQQRNNWQAQVMMLPFQCRERLETGTPLTEAELPIFWDVLQQIDQQTMVPFPPEEPGIVDATNAIYGGITVLLVLHWAWVVSDSARLAWCRGYLEKMVGNQPSLSSYEAHMPTANRDRHVFAAECGIALLAENASDLLARCLVTQGVMADRYATTAATMQRALQYHERLGDDFNRLIHLSVRWSMVRRLLERAQQLRRDAEHWRQPTNQLVEQLEHDVENWQQRRDQLAESFISGSLAEVIPSLHETQGAARAEMKALHQRTRQAWQENDSNPLLGPRWQLRSLRLRPFDPRLDVMVLQSAFTWLDVSIAHSPEARNQWVGILRALLTICLQRRPRVRKGQARTHDDLPSNFEQFVFRLVARALLHLRPQEDPASFWRPILDLGAPAHYWVEHFFWEWFTEGVGQAQAPGDFTHIWSEMLYYAASHPRWMPGQRHSYHLATMVSELLGFSKFGTTVASDHRFAESIKQMMSAWEQAVQRWLTIPRVTSGFAWFIIQPASIHLLLPGLRWLYEATQTFDDYSWRRESGLDDNLVDTLRTCWERHQAEVSTDPVFREAFQGLLTCLASRGGHAAAALRERVLDSIPNAG